MKSVKLISFSIVSVALSIGGSLFIGGCATTSANSFVDKNYTLKTFSLRNETNLSERDCPVTSHGWRDDNLVKLIRDANACEQYHHTSRLEQIGNVLARQYSTKPWGPFYLSLSAYDQKQYPRALWMVELALKKAPNVGLMTYQRARVLLAMGRLASAAKAFHTSVDEQPNLVDARLYLAQLNVRDGNFSGAESQLEKVVSYEPNDHAAWANLGEVYISLHNSSDAIEAYQHAVNLSPDNVQYRLRLAHLYENAKNLKAALAAYEKVKELAEDSRVPANQIDVNLKQKISQLKKATEPTKVADATGIKNGEKK